MTIDENLEALMDSAVEETKDCIKLTDDKIFSIIFTGSKISGYGDRMSDLDITFISEQEVDSTKYFFNLNNGQLIDVTVYTLNGLREQVLSKEHESIKLRDKLLFSPTILYKEDSMLRRVFDEGIEQSIDDFLSFIGHLSGSIPRNRRALFDLKSVVEWPDLMQLFYYPVHRHRIARRLSSSKRKTFLASQMDRYRELMHRFVSTGLVKPAEADSYEYLGERGTPFEAYFPIVLHFFRKNLNYAYNMLNRVRKKIAQSHEKELRMPIDFHMKLKSKLLLNFEYLHLFYFMAKGGLSFRNEGPDYIYHGPSLDRITRDSYSYRLVKNKYEILRSVINQALRNMVYENNGLLRIA